jgi:PDZ domain-containing protein
MPLPSIERIPGGRAFAAMSRRVRTLTVAGVLFVVLFLVALFLPVPYVILTPGPTYNTLGRDPFSSDAVVVLTGRTANATSGHLNMTTVRIQDESVTAATALIAWLKGDQMVLPKTAITPPGVSDEEQEKQDTQDFVTSQDSATVAALCELGYPKAFGVVSVADGGPADGVLHTGDQFVTVDGRAADSSAKLLGVLQSLRPGTTVPVVVKRQGRQQSLAVKVGPAPSGSKGARLGVTVSTTCLAPFTVKINLERVGGPSAGLMFALAILDKAGRQNLTGGRFIAGTGEISTDGKVGPIGGIQLKMIAAKRKGATVFLAPAGNCGDVRKATPSGLKVIKVSTLHGAVQDLLALQRGASVPSC